LAQTSPSGELRDDLDMVSGMLTAIRDFAKDSLGEEGELNEIKHGEELILLQTSNDIYVAAVLSGTIPQGYNALSRLVVSEINAKYEQDFRDFDGNMDNVPSLADELRPLLYPYDILKPAGMSSKQKKTAFAIFIALLLLLALSIFSCFFTIRLWPYAFPVPTSTPTSTPQPTSTSTLIPSPTRTMKPTPTVTPTLRPDQGMAIGNVNIRSGAGTENPVLDILYEGERFSILEKGDGWLYIRREVEGKPEIEGWVNQLWIIR
ncbi:MAG: SH3 domain-containing protein, partial [Anaerolineae bacterium]|nr:SH3 domain-containing protein [Anaerolineae bacterium]